MSDEDIQTAQERRAGETKHRAAVEKMRQGWIVEGYDPVRHMAEVRLDGDGTVIRSFYERERDSMDRRRDIGCWLAAYDMLDIQRVAQRQRRV